MPAVLPYLVAPGSIKTCLDRIKSAATPDRVRGDFVSTMLQIKGGTGAALIPFLKRIGFVASDGAPTEIYKRFRNASTSGVAVAEAIRIGYKELGQVNEYFFKLSDKDLLGLILQITGSGADDKVAKLILSTLNNLKSYANFEAPLIQESQAERLAAPVLNSPEQLSRASVSANQSLGLNLSYTINLNLPATADQAVFNAIFRSLKEHLLSSRDE